LAETWVEVNLANIAHNTRAVKDLIGPDTQLMAVVKANAYGHGAVPVARTVLASGADWLGVFKPEEAVQLRAAGIMAPILVMGAFAPDEAEAVVEMDLTVAVSTPQQAQSLEQAAARVGKQARVHLEVDTGLGRYGMKPAELPALAERVDNSNYLFLEGVFTHLSAGPTNKQAAQRQLAAFLASLPELDRPIPLRHAASSGSLLSVPEARLDMVRIGTMLYGQSHHQIPSGMELKPVFELCTRITHITSYRKGERIGYGNGVRLRRDTRVAVVPVGYAEGFGMEPSRAPETMLELLRNCAKQFLRYIGHGRVTEKAIWNSRPVPVLGRVGMQHTTLDITDLMHAGPQVGDIVMLPVRRVLVGPHVPRCFFGEEVVTQQVREHELAKQREEVASSVG
jgi:alanine racemase